MTAVGCRSVRVSSPTEDRNPRTADIDRLPSLDLLRLLNAEDARVPAAVASALPELARAVDLAVAAIGDGGSVHYFGAGTSGRLAVLDVAELGPTYALPDGTFQAHHAGGTGALWQALENVEDDVAAGTAAAAAVRPGDLVMGLTASGRTPFVLAALAAARRTAAPTALVTANPGAADDRHVLAAVDVLVVVDTGPEAIAGSTRMKAGTAQKQVLTAFSTAVMVRTGHTYSNLMVDLVATNAKLRGRTVTVLAEATGLEPDECTAVLADTGGELKTALVTMLGAVPVATARAALARHGGRVRDALDGLRS